MQYVAIFAGVGGVQHSIYCQYLQGVERHLIVVSIWSNICFQNRSKSLKIAPKNEKSLKIAPILPASAPQHRVNIQNVQYLQGPKAVNLSIYCQYLQRKAVNIQHQHLLRNRQLIQGWLCFPTYQGRGGYPLRVNLILSDQINLVI